MNKLILYVIITLLSISLSNYAMIQELNEKLRKSVDLQDLELMEEALQEGADPNHMVKYWTNETLKYWHGDKPILHYAILQSCDSKVIELLLKYGANINITERNNWNALFWAIERNNLIIAQLLIKQGIDLNLQGLNNDTCLHRIIQCKFPFYNDPHNTQKTRVLKIINLLLQFGADINIENNQNKTFLDLVKQSQYKDILKVVKEWQEITNKKILEETSPYMPPVLGNIVSEYVIGPTI